MAYEARHMKPQVKALLIEALGPGYPQLTVDEFTSVDKARQEMHNRWNNANKRNGYVFEDSYIEEYCAAIYADEPYEWQVYEIRA